MSAFLRLLTYVRRTILRARTRSLLTLVGHRARDGAVRLRPARSRRGVAALASRSNQPVLVVFQTSRFCPLTSDLPIRYADEVRKMPGVASVLPTLLYVNACRANLDLVTLHGVPTRRGGRRSTTWTSSPGDLDVVEGDQRRRAGRASAWPSAGA